jgi:hypothetical protein
MSSATEPSTPAVDHRAPKVVVISHSSLFYWWPVWSVGFLMAGLTYWSGYRVAFVPPDTKPVQGAEVKGYEGRRDVLIAPEGQSLPAASVPDELKRPRLRMVISNDLGIIWALMLCLVIFLTNIPLRGMWSFVVIIVLAFTSVLLAVLGLWDDVFRSVRILDIHLTAFSYLSISLFLFVIWLLTVLVFDRMVYMVFTRGQLRVRMAISQGEKVYDTRGMVVERHRDDLFRHWLLGFGSGDLTVHTGGSSSQQLQLPNVLGIGRKLKLVHTMLQEREVVRGSR